MRNAKILIKGLKIFHVFITTLLLGTSLTSYSQGCLEVPKSIINGTNGFSILGKNPNDNLGSKTKSAGDINHDGIDDIMIGAPYADFEGNVNVGEIYVIFGKTGLSIETFDVSTLDGTNGFILRGVDPNEKFGAMIDTAGDFNNDGIDDILIGYNNATGKGRAVVFYGKSSGFSAIYKRTDFNLANSVTFTIDLFSSTTSIKDVSYAGDINNDGVADIVFNMYGNDKANIFVVFGQAAITDMNTSALNGTNGFYILGFSQLFSGQGSIVRNAGDINNDGKDDLIFGFPGYDETSDNSEGRAVVWFGKNSYTANYQLDAINVSDGFIITNTGRYTSMGISVAGVGDFNNDAIDDILIGASGKTINHLEAAGEVYLIYGRNSAFPAIFSASTLNASTGVIFQGKEAYDQLGGAVSSLKDVNNDSKNDIIIASKRGGKANNGAVYIVFGGGSATGIVGEDMIFGNVGYQVFNDQELSSYLNFGEDVAGIRDFNNDGTNDFVVGSIPGATYHNHQGLAYIFYGEKLNRIDTESPDISCIADQELYVNASLPNYISFLSNVSDNCTYNTDLFLTQSPPQGTLFTGDTQVTITVRDKSGNSNSCTFLVRLKTNSTEIDCKTFTLNVNNLNGNNGFRLYGETPSGNTGYAVDTVGDVNGDGISDFIVSDIGKNTPFLGPYRNYTRKFEGSGYIVFGTDSGFPPNINLALLNGTNGFAIRNDTDTDYLQTGQAVSAAGDINGDGIGDFMISASLKRWTNWVEGATYIVFGKSGFFPAEFFLSDLDGNNGFVIAGTEYYEALGFNIDNIGDFNHDGFDDIAIVGTSRVPKCYIIYGKSTGFPALIKGDEIDGTNGFIIEGDTTVDKIGNSVAGLGDVNGDGISDIAIGGTGTSDKKYVIYGKTNFTAILKITDLNGTNGFKVMNSVKPLTYEYVAGVGDMNGDGINDISFGKNLILFGSSTFPVTIDLNDLNGMNGFKLLNSGYADKFGKAGDFNKDSFDDFIFIKNDAAYILYGKDSWDANVDTDLLTAKDGLKIILDNTNYHNVSYAGDVNKDGIDDVVIGSYNYNLSGNIYDQPGSAFVIFGKQITPDTEKPVITNCPANQVLAINDPIPDYKSAITVTDNCDDTPIITQSPASGTVFDGVSQEVTLTVTDASGNFETCKFTIATTSTTDTQAPIVTCPANQQLTCGTATIPDYTASVTVSDDVDPSPTVTQNPVAGSPFADGMTVTITAKDASGNESDCTFKINASADVTKPVITCIGNQTLAFGDVLPDYSALITATDNCDTAPIVTQTPAAGSPFVDGMTVEISAKDASGNTETCSFLINESVDTEKPVITCLTDQSVDCSTIVVADYTNLVTATDNNDSNPVITQSPAAGSPFTDGMTITITAKDASGNESDCSFKISASEDVTKPVITCIGSQSLSCSSILPDYTKMITATDNCDAAPVITQNPSEGSLFTDGMTVTITAKDASGNESSCSFIINVSADVTKPVITCVGNQTLASGDVLPDYSALATATDNCDAAPIVTQNPVAGSAFTDGMTVVISATDASGNTETCSFVITAKAETDTQAPVITCLTNQQVSCSTAKVPDYTSVISVTDNKDPNPTVKQSPAPGSVFKDGMTVTITATDASSNKSTCSFKINSDILLVDAGNDIEIKQGELVQLEAVATEEGSFKWTPTKGVSNAFISNPFFSPVETTTYTVSFTNKEGCEVHDSVIISVEPKEKDETKYGFSPNNDGINDFWMIHDITNYPDNEVSIYSSWGDLVFQTKGYNNSTNVFSGIANRKRNLGADRLPEGTYFFEINPNAASHHFKKLKGYLVLKR